MKKKSSRLEQIKKKIALEESKRANENEKRECRLQIVRDISKSMKNVVGDEIVNGEKEYPELPDFVDGQGYVRSAEQYSPEKLIEEAEFNKENIEKVAAADDLFDNKGLNREKKEEKIIWSQREMDSFKKNSRLYYKIILEVEKIAETLCVPMSLIVEALINEHLSTEFGRSYVIPGYHDKFREFIVDETLSDCVSDMLEKDAFDYSFYKKHD